MQREDEHADDVFPEESGREQVAAEDVFFPEAPGDHDRVQHKRLDYDRHGGGCLPIADGEVAQDQAKAEEKDRELDRSENALHQRPARRIAPSALVRSVKVLVRNDPGFTTLRHRASLRFLSFRYFPRLSNLDRFSG